MKYTYTPRKQDGFALIVAISLMAFVLVLLLSIATLVRVEAVTAKNSMLLLEARQNARLGLMQALGDLQKHAGPDQRVSARAELLDGDPTTEEMDGYNAPVEAYSKWTGIWDTSNYNLRDSDSSNETKPRPYWLISFDGDSTDREDINLASDTLPGDPDMVELVSVKNGAPVSVPIVNLGDNRGRIAWWVGDEGVKANIGNPSLAPSYQNTLNHSLVIPLTSGYPLLQMESGDKPFADRDPVLESKELYSREALGVVVGDSSTKVFFHDITTRSMGLLTDVKNGGLKFDLTTELDRDLGNLSGAIFEDPQNSDADFMEGYGPTWELVRSFYQQTIDARDGSLEVQGHQGHEWKDSLYANYDDRIPSDGDLRIQHGVSPVVSAFQLYFDAMIFEETPGEYRCRVYYKPAITIWNPYNKRMTSSTPLTFVYTSRGRHKIVVDYLEGENVWYWSHKPAIESARMGIFSGFRSIADEDISSSDDNLKFSLPLPPEGIAPGEAVTYTLDTNTVRPVAGEAIVLSTSGFHGYGVYEESVNTIPIAPDSTDPTAIPVERSLNLRFMSDNDSLTDPGSRVPFAMRLYKGDEDKNNLLKFVTGITGPFFPGNVESWDHYGKGWIGLTQLASSDPDEHPGVNGSLFVNSDLTNSVAFGFEAALQFPRIEALEGPDINLTAWPLDFRERSSIYAHYNLRAPRLLNSASMDGLLTNPGYTKLYYGITHFREIEIGTAYPVNLSGQVGDSDWANANKMTLFDVPSADYPLHSIAQLSQLNLADTLFAKNHQIASSYGNPMLNPWELYHNRSMNEFKDLPTPIADYSYLANDALWDRFFFSTRRHSVQPDILAYPNYVISEAAQNDQTLLDDPEYAARELAIAGSFNVNSTSVGAWKVFLGAFFQKSQKVDTFAGETTLEAQAPFLRFAVPQSNVWEDYNSSASSLTTDEIAFTGFRSLSEDEITELAENIVEQVKKRGPFLSLSEFVNRRYEPRESENQIVADNLTINQLADIPEAMGTLQAAIEKSGLNATLNSDANFMSPGETKLMFNRDQYPPNRMAAAGSIYRDTPGYLSQIDILTPLGGLISARSDTFLIRSYGEVKTIKGETVEAWIEATVQRTVKDVNGASVNDFGRQLEIVDLRWLSSGEI